MNIILLGAQGSGKGTQAKKLAQALEIVHISSGDLLRKEAHDGTELGRKAQEYLNRGELVPDDLTVSMMLQRIAEPDCVQNGVLLDGFPRTIAQAQALDESLASLGRKIDCALYLKVPREILLHRLSGRYICQAHQHVYNIETNPPRVAGKCDIDGSELVQRADDQGPAVQKRLDIFFQGTIHLLDYYQRQHKLAEVNGNQAIDQVHQNLLMAAQHSQEKN